MLAKMLLMRDMVYRAKVQQPISEWLIFHVRKVQTALVGRLRLRTTYSLVTRHHTASFAVKGVRRALGSVVHGRFTNSFDRRDFSCVKKHIRYHQNSLSHWVDGNLLRLSLALFLFDWDLWMCSKTIRSWMSSEDLGSKITWVDAQSDTYIMKFGVVTEWLSHLFETKK